MCVIIYQIKESTVFLLEKNTKLMYQFQTHQLLSPIRMILSPQQLSHLSSLLHSMSPACHLSPGLLQ